MQLKTAFLGRFLAEPVLAEPGFCQKKRAEHFGQRVRTYVTHPEPAKASSGVAAEMRAAQKVGKYGALAAQVSSSFHPALIERYGACCEALWGFLRTAVGDRDRDPLRHDDVTFSHSSRGTYAAGMLVFAAVIGDAALIAEVIDVDTHGRDPRAVPGAPAPPRADAGAFSSSLPPTQREIEGAGGEMWYEARHIGAGRAA